jgi:phage-related protein
MLVTSYFNDPKIQGALGFLSKSVNLLVSSFTGLGQDQNTKNLIATLTTQFPQLKGFIDAILPSIEGIGKAFGSIGPAIKGVNEFISNIFKGFDFGAILSGIFTLDLSKLGVEFSKIGTAVNTELEKVRNSVGKFFTDSFNSTQLPDINLPFIGNLRTAFEDLKKFLSQPFVIPQFILDIGTQFSKILPALQSFGSFVTSLILPPLQQFGNFITTTILPALQSFGAYIINGILPNLTALWNFISPVLIPVLQVIAAIIGGVIVLAIAAVIIAIGLFIAGIAGAVFILGQIISVISFVANIIFTVLFAAFNAIIGIVTAVFGTVFAYLSAVFQTIVAIFTGNFGSIQGIWSGFLSTIGNLWKNAWDGITNFVSVVWGLISLAITTGFNAAKSVVSLGLSFLKGIWDTAWNSITSTVSNVWETIKTGVSNGITAVVDYFNGLGSQIIGIVSGIDLGAIGRNMIQTMIDGIKSMAGAVAGAINGLLRNVSGGAFGLPGYANGVTNFGGGPAIVGEQGFEVLRTPSGRSYIANSPQLLNLPRGTDVYTNAQSQKMLAGRGGNGGVQVLERTKTINNAPVYQNFGSTRSGGFSNLIQAY